MNAPFTESGSDLDYSGLMGEVALALLGEPTSKRQDGREWRYGTHGSLSVSLHESVYFDHEAKHGGGVLDLIVWVIGGDHSDAVKWLHANILRSTRRNGQTSDAYPAPRDDHRTDAKPNGNSSSSRRIVATYKYVDENGKTLFEVVRFEPKSFAQRRPDERGGKLWNLDGARLVPYRLPELIQAAASGRVVFIVEGEKDADNLNAIGITATTNSMGAGKWRDEYGDFLRAPM
jgi:putative DNA primase/helicase